MAGDDKDIEAGLPQPPSPSYQLPDWEGSITPQPQKKRSFMGRLADQTSSTIKPSITSLRDQTTSAIKPSLTSLRDQTTSVIKPSITSLRASRSTSSSESWSWGKSGKEKENDKVIETGPSYWVPRHTLAAKANGTSTPTATTAPPNKPSKASTALAAVTTACSIQLDRALPPDRTYLGRSRKFFLWAIVFPLALIFLLILPLGLGIGLSHKSAHALPLPDGDGSIYTGDLTYYQPGLGACGWTHTAGDSVAAISRQLWDARQEGSNPNTNPFCGRKIRVERNFVEEDKGVRTVDVTVVDRCVNCEPNDLDLSLGMFTQLATEVKGRVTVRWAWLPEEEED